MVIFNSYVSLPEGISKLGGENRESTLVGCVFVDVDTVDLGVPCDKSVSNPNGEDWR